MTRGQKPMRTLGCRSPQGRRSQCHRRSPRGPMGVEIRWVTGGRRSPLARPECHGDAAPQVSHARRGGDPRFRLV